MFYLVRINDKLIIKACELDKDIESVALIIAKNKYINRLIPEEGLCIKVENIHIIECIINPGEGDLQLELELSILIFTPIKNEIICARVLECNPQGIIGIYIYIYIGSLEFMKVFIPGELLMSDSRFDGDERVWIWRYLDEDEMEQPDAGYDWSYELNDIIRFKVHSTNFESNPTNQIEDIGDIENQKSLQYNIIVIYIYIYIYWI